MAAFELDADLTHAADFGIARDGGVAIYRNKGLLRTVVAELHSLRYEVVRIDASKWSSEADMLDGLARALNFPDYFGRNRDALLDCLSDVSHGDYGWHVSTTGLTAVLETYRPFAERWPKSASFLSESLRASSREGMLFGHRLIWLLDDS